MIATLGRRGQALFAARRSPRNERRMGECFRHVGGFRESIWSIGVAQLATWSQSSGRTDGARTKAFDPVRDILRDGGCGLRAKSGPPSSSGSARPHCATCPSTHRTANSPARPGAAQTAIGARLRIQERRSQDRGSGPICAAEARLRAAMLPEGGKGRARTPAIAAGIE